MARRLTRQAVFAIASSYLPGSQRQAVAAAQAPTDNGNARSGLRTATEDEQAARPRAIPQSDERRRCTVTMRRGLPGIFLDLLDAVARHTSITVVHAAKCFSPRLLTGIKSAARARCPDCASAPRADRVPCGLMRSLPVAGWQTTPPSRSMRRYALSSFLILQGSGRFLHTAHACRGQAHLAPRPAPHAERLGRCNRRRRRSKPTICRLPVRRALVSMTIGIWSAAGSCGWMRR